jgi:hypothetical protein
MAESSVPTVPHRIGWDAQGCDGTMAWLELPEPRDRLTLWAVGCGIGGVQLDLAGVLDLQAMLGAAAAAMQMKPGLQGVTGKPPAAG